MAQHECNNPDTATHTQLPYTTKNGVETTVDRGSAFTMELLKRNGVETFFSCEDNDGSAYFLADGRDMLRLERRAKKLVKKGQLTAASKMTVRRLFGFRHTVELSHFIEDGTNLIFQLHFGEIQYNNGSAACVTKSYSTTHGFRTCVRWPTKVTSDINKLLAELMPEQSSEKWDRGRLRAV